MKLPDPISELRRVFSERADHRQFLGINMAIGSRFPRVVWLDYFSSELGVLAEIAPDDTQTVPALLNEIAALRAGALERRAA